MQKIFMAIYAALYRLTKGRIGGSMGRQKVLLLTTTGRKSGKARTVALGTWERQGSWLIVASNGGKSTHPAWYLNLKSKPQAAVQVLDKVMSVTAEVLTGEPRAQAWQQVISASPSYANYEKRTSREIPLVLLHPGK
jgi:deazaflavin-dependent oxidoreductase (nitroreductase family)